MEPAEDPINETPVNQDALENQVVSVLSHQSIKITNSEYKGSNDSFLCFSESKFLRYFVKFSRYLELLEIFFEIFRTFLENFQKHI